MSRAELVAAMKAVWQRHTLDLQDGWKPGIEAMIEEFADVAEQHAQAPAKSRAPRVS